MRLHANAKQLGLRSEELRTLRTSNLIRFRAGSATPWLHVTGKGNRDRELPLPAEVQRTLMAWLDVRPQKAQDNPLLFPRLGRQTHDGRFPGAAGAAPRPLSATALANIVRPLMAGAGVAPEHCHPHVLRHTFATLYLQRRAHDPAALTKLQELLGHASLETTRGYLHHTRDELERSMLSPERSVLDAAAGARRTRNAQRAAFGGCWGRLSVVRSASGDDELVIAAGPRARATAAAPDAPQSHWRQATVGALRAARPWLRRSRQRSAARPRSAQAPRSHTVTRR
jgi:hypothetical protein